MSDHEEQATADKAQADETITAARTDEPKQEWRRTSEQPEMWQKGDSSSRLAAWSPQMDEQLKPAEPAGPDDETREQRWAREGIEVSGQSAARSYASGDPITVAGPIPRMAMQGVAAVPRPVVSQHRTVCEHCQGSGFMPGISDYLRESIALVGDQGDEVIRHFYERLFTAAPDLVKLFPGDPTKGDLGTDHKGAKQREKLLAAIVALSDLYDPDDPEKMKRLDNALRSFGRSHAAFSRGDGTVKGADWEEYAAVKEALFATLVSAAGNSWKSEYTESWSQAYDYAAAVMLAEQHRSGFSLPRFPRA